MSKYRTTSLNFSLWNSPWPVGFPLSSSWISVLSINKDDPKDHIVCPLPICYDLCLYIMLDKIRNIQNGLSTDKKKSCWNLFFSVCGDVGWRLHMLTPFSSMPCMGKLHYSCLSRCFPHTQGVLRHSQALTQYFLSQFLDNQLQTAICFQMLR